MRATEEKKQRLEFERLQHFSVADLQQDSVQLEEIQEQLFSELERLRAELDSLLIHWKGNQL